MTDQSMNRPMFAGVRHAEAAMFPVPRARIARTRIARARITRAPISLSRMGLLAVCVTCSIASATAPPVDTSPADTSPVETSLADTSEVDNATQNAKAASAGSTVVPPDNRDGLPPDMEQMLIDYFQEKSESRRKKIARRIEKGLNDPDTAPGPADDPASRTDDRSPDSADDESSGESDKQSAVTPERIEPLTPIERVAKSLPALPLWSRTPRSATPDETERNAGAHGNQEVENQSAIQQFHTLECKTDRNLVRLSFRLPDAYEADRPHPLLVVFAKETLAPKDLQQRLSAFPALNPPWIIASPEVIQGQDVGTTWLGAGTDAFTWLRELSRAIRIDRNRVFALVECNDGWRCLAGARDLFAGAITLSPWTDLPYPNEFLPLIAGNLRELPIVMFGTRGSDISGQPDSSLQAFNDVQLVALAEAGAPVRRVDLLAGVNPIGALRRNRHQLEWVVNQQRQTSGHRNHLFRFEKEGITPFARCGRMRGDPWLREQISIRPASDADRKTFTTDTLKNLHGSLAIERLEHVITVTANRCARVEVRWPLADVKDGTRWTVVCNGKKREEKIIKPDLEFMLQHVYDTWDFQRLLAAKTAFNLRDD